MIASTRTRSSELLHFTEHGSGPALVLLHGMMVSGEMFAPVLTAFASRHRVIIPDLRGHGLSRALPPPYAVPALAADVARLLDHVGVASAALLGYSQGGAVAQQLAVDHPERCARLVLACAYAYNMASLREKVEGHLAPFLIRALGMPRFARMIISQGASDLAAERAEWLAGLIASQDRALMVAAWKEGMAFDGRPRLREIRCPTLVIAGSKDTAVPMHHTQALHDGIRGAQLAIVDGAGHALIWTHPDAVVGLTEEFLLGSVPPQGMK